MLLVIFGAGASYDSLPSRRPLPASRDPLPPSVARPSDGREAWRPPLANDLFARRTQFEDVRRHYPELFSLVPTLADRPEGVSLEDALEEIALDAERVPRYRPQLMALRYYLRRLIVAVQHSWNGGTGEVETNYQGLLGQLEVERERRVIDEKACLVTFNYDTLLEGALRLEGQLFQTSAQYFPSSGYRLFKPHGSVDWARPLENLPRVLQQRIEADAEHSIIAAATSIDATGAVGLPAELPRVPMIPAIAVPLKSKSTMECPPGHVDAFAALLPRVRSILTVGWRAGERHFLEILQRNLTRRVDLMCVGAGEDDARTIASELSEFLDVASASYGREGFSHFVATREGIPFIRTAMERWIHVPTT